MFMKQNGGAFSTSPRSLSVSLSHILPELLQFTLNLSSHNDSLLPRSLPSHFCSSLLENEHSSSQHNEMQDLHDIPLWKKLSTRLFKAIECGTFPRKNAQGVNEDEAWVLKVDCWSKQLASFGSRITEVLQMPKFEIHVQEPYFTQLRYGHKTVEGRCAVGDYRRISPGDFLLINTCLLLIVEERFNFLTIIRNGSINVVESADALENNPTKVKWYNSFLEMIVEEKIENILPDIKTLEEGVQVYRRFYSEEKERIGGVLAIHVHRAPTQPYILMSDILTDLQEEGIREILE